jgi:transposase
MKQNTANFSGKTIFVGMDIHKNSWNLGIYLEDNFIRNVHQKPSPSLLEQYLHKHYPVAKYVTAYEAGKFGYWIHRQLTSQGITCLVVNPADIPKSQKDKLQKTDASDSRNIGSQLQKGQLISIHIPSEQQEADRLLYRHRKRIWKDLVRCKNRIKGHLAYVGLEIPVEYDNSSWSKNFINWLKNLPNLKASSRLSLDYQIVQMEFLRKELLKISNDIRTMMREQRYKKNYYLLRSIPGIGPLTAASILVELGSDMTRFKRFEELNSFVGLLPLEHSSGESENKGNLTVRRHKQLRSDLIECAWTAKRIDPALSLYYTEHLKRKEHNVVIIKIARKLLSRIRYVLVNQKEYVKGVVK